MPEDAPNEEEKRMDLADFCDPSYSDLHGIQTAELEGIDDAIAEDARRQKLAQQIWEDGNALEYICASCREMHTGDEAAIEAMIISYTVTRVTDSYGLHVSVSGPAGSGKSHVGDTVKAHLPEGSVMDSRMSDKALLYHKIPDKTPLLIDDQALSEGVQELLKNATTNWDERTTYITVRNQTPQTLELPARSPFWTIKVEFNGDEQILDRQLIFWTDDSFEQKQAISDMIKAGWRKNAENQETGKHSPSADISRRIWQFVPEETLVDIPFANRINTTRVPDPRIIHMLGSLIQGIAVLRGPCREINPGAEPRLITAKEEDYYEAVRILNPLLQNRGGSQKLKLSKGANEVLKYLSATYATKQTVPFEYLRRACGMSMAQLTHAIFGRNDTETDGLLGVCPAIEVVDVTHADDACRGTMRRKAVLWSPNVYIGWEAAIGIFSLDPEK